MTNYQKQQLEDFNGAKEIAFTIEKGCYQRDKLSNYCGMKSYDGRYFVLGDTKKDIQNAKIIINRKPAREVFEGFTIMIN